MTEPIARLTDPSLAERWCKAARAAGASLGFVPTMGALHAGHLELVRRARAENALACVSVFVNPLQFDDPSDLAAYPRDFEGDVAQLAGVGCSMVFTGTLAEFFPGRLDVAGRLPREQLVDPGPAAEGLEGAFRSGHFAGVATIVQRLFEIVEPARAYFGEKDFQQCLVVEHVARRRGAPQVVICPTVREAGGLALSSRNVRLATAEQETALALVRALHAARDAWRAGERMPDPLCAVMEETLAVPGVEPEYAEVRDPARWTAQRPLHRLIRARALVAARIGDVRLIDNLDLGQA